jgi:hypothetical protein
MADRRSFRRSAPAGLARLGRAVLFIGLGVVISMLLRAPMHAVSWALVLHLPPWLSGPLLLLTPLLWWVMLMGLLAFAFSLVPARHRQPRRLFSRY